MNRIVILLIAAVSFLLSVYITSLKPSKPESRKHNNAERSGALQALNFWTASRAYPYADIPSDKYYRSFVESKQTLKGISHSPFSSYQWQFLGPVNLSGRTIALALNPVDGNTLYAGSASGGLWRSYTGGVQGDWERVVTGYPVLGVNAIAIDPTDTSTIYIGTGEVYQASRAFGGTVIRTTRGSYGMGILKTTDNGETWTKSLDWSYNQQQGVQVIKINSLNPKTLWAGTTDGLLKSTDGGESWENLLFLQVMDLLIHPDDTNTVIISCGNFGNGPVVLRTTDGGNDWDPMMLPSFTGKTMLAMCASVPNTVYASVADSTTGVSSVWRTDDFGSYWYKQCDQTTNNIIGVQGWYSHYLAVHPNDPETVVYGGVSIGKSTDGGQWFAGVSSSYSDHHAYAIHPVNPDILYDANDDGIYRSTNFGSSFSYVSNGYTTGQFYNGFSNSTTDSLLAIGQVQDHIPGYIYTGSATWWRSAIDEVGWTAITPGADSIMFAVARGGGSVARSTDRGFSFGYTGVGGYGAWCSPIAVSPSSPATVYFGTDKIYRSLNHGEYWEVTNSNTVLDGNPALSLAIAPSNASVVYVGTTPLYGRGHIWRTANGGSNWQNVTGTLPDRYPNDIAVDPSNTNIVYAAMGGFEAGHFYKSTTGGSTWTNISTTLPDVPGTAIMIDPLNSQNIFIGNDIGVYISTNGGSSWSNFSEGLPEAVLVSDLTYSPANRALRVTTHGNGVFERKLPNSFPAIFLISPNGSESWEGATTHTIEWTSFLTGLIKIEYSTDNGSSWTTIADSVPSSPPRYSWRVAPIVSNNTKIRLSAEGAPSYNDVSDTPFSIYFSGTVVTTQSGWNLISLPIHLSDRRVSTLFPSATSYLFGYDRGYVQKESLSEGTGYWLKFNAGNSIVMRGDSIQTDTITVSEGWNIIGSLTKPVPISSIVKEPADLLMSNFFEFSNGYSFASIIESGKGYWIKTRSSGKMILSAVATSQNKVSAPTLSDGYNRLTVTDAQGYSQSLYFTSTAPLPDPDLYELPPLPPTGIFDARFATQRMVEIVNQERQTEFPIELHSAAYPVTLSWEMVENNASWSVSSTGHITIINGNGSITITDQEEPMSLRLVFQKRSDVVPVQTQLLQNYPNPFNPQTQLRFTVGIEGLVTMKVYDATGKEIATIVNEVMNAGSYTRIWNASEKPSGIYFVQMTANGIHHSRKIVLIK